MFRSRIGSFRLLATAALGCVLVGCGGGKADAPPLGAVSGVVKLDGKPIEGVMVIFESTTISRNSNGMTDKDGKYELSYSQGVKGAPIGKCKIKFDMPMQPDKGIHMSALPVKYLTDPQFEKDVVKDKNEFDFDLSSEGAVGAPGMMPGAAPGGMPGAMPGGPAPPRR